MHLHRSLVRSDAWSEAKISAKSSSCLSIPACALLVPITSVGEDTIGEKESPQNLEKKKDTKLRSKQT